MEDTLATTKQIIEITELAAQKLEETLEEQGENGSMLRVMVMPGGHGGVQYMLGIESEAKEDDFIIDVDTIKVLVDSESAPLVEGAEIDYVEGLMRSGFVISNPNIQAHGGGCGCGRPAEEQSSESCGLKSSGGWARVGPVGEGWLSPRGRTGAELVRCRLLQR